MTAEPEWTRTRWLHILAPDGSLWMETSSPTEIRDEGATHPDWPPQRLYSRNGEYEWRDVSAEELAADCQAEDEFYRVRRQS